MDWIITALLGSVWIMTGIFSLGAATAFGIETAAAGSNGRKPRGANAAISLTFLTVSSIALWATITSVG